MIQAKDIRVGAIFNRKHGKGWTETIINEEIIGKIFSGDKEYALDDFEPIQINDEILAMYNFEFFDYYILDDYAGNEILKHYKLPFNDSSDCYYCLEQDESGEFRLSIERDGNDKIDSYISVSLSTIRYEHQFRDICLSLTAKEINRTYK